MILVEPNFKPRRSFRRAATFLLAASFAAGSIVTVDLVADPLKTSTQAKAYSYGPGVYIGGNGIGSFWHSNGLQMYCLEIAKPINTVNAVDAPLAETNAIPAMSVASFEAAFGGTFRNVEAAAVSGDALKMINWILTRYGSTADNQQAAATQMAIWAVRYHHGSNAEYKRLYHHYVEHTERYSPGISVLMDRIYQQAKAAITAENNQTIGGVDMAVHSTGGYAGIVTVPAGTLELTVTNGLLKADDGSWHKKLTFGANGTPADKAIEWKGEPGEEDSWNRYYRVVFDGKRVDEFRYTPAKIIYANEGATQSTGRPSNEPPIVERRETPLNTNFADPDTVWQPVVSSQVPSQKVRKGAKFSDTVTFGVAEGSEEWRKQIQRDGSTAYAPIKATGTLYGPFLSDPALNPAATVPNGAPVVGRTEITTDERKGPGTYEVNADWKAEEAGYYSWVWNIEYDQQLTEVKTPTTRTSNLKTAPAIPLNYFFTDGFGQVAEMQYAPTRLDINTKLSDSEVVIGGMFTDQVEVALERGSGGWLQADNGERIPAVLRGKMYYSKSVPVQQAIVPADAKQIGNEVTVTVNKPETSVSSEKFRVPVTADAGYLTVVWCVYDEDQPENVRGRIEETCDDYGVPSETAKIVKPEVSTQADKQGAYRGEIKDTALVEGKLPDLPARVKFEAFMKPEPGAVKVDSNWKPVLDSNGVPVKWTAAEIAALKPGEVCEVQKIAETSPVTVKGAGTYTSPVVKANTVGTVYWVESLEIKDPEDGVYKVVHRGKCGLPNETSVIDYPKVTTKAMPEAVAGDKITDTAIVTGEVTSDKNVKYEVTFKAFNVTGLSENTHGQKANWCTTERLVFETKNPVTVSKAGEYVSEAFETSEKHVGDIYWVETLWISEDGKEKRELYSGACGAVSEITKVKKKPELAVTGSTGQLTSFGIAAVMLLAAGCLLTAARKRKPASIN